MHRLALHVALAVVGVAAIVWALVWSATPTITCRGVVMQPGEVCANATGTRTQTYEERFAAAQQARPVIGGLGGVILVFGAGLAFAERRQPVAGQAS